MSVLKNLFLKFLKYFLYDHEYWYWISKWFFEWLKRDLYIINTYTKFSLTPVGYRLIPLSNSMARMRHNGALFLLHSDSWFRVTVFVSYFLSEGILILVSKLNYKNGPYRFVKDFYLVTIKHSFIFINIYIYLI